MIYIKETIKVIIFTTLFSALLLGCGRVDPFEENMRNGKDALIDGNYEEAVRYFEIALIEKPRDEDAKLLIEHSWEKLKLKQASKEIDEYVKITDGMVTEYKEFLLKYEGYEREKNVLPSPEFIKDTNRLYEMIAESKLILKKYKKDTAIYELHEKLISSIEGSHEALTGNSVISRSSLFSGFILESYIEMLDEIKSYQI